ncbi:MAG: preprotein translocase subunit YajC [Opitutales bacterium]|nr:preprotein translocase subunit YajC [Opitutales bacterium]MCH8540456.1 preprotein translocase subunit YajC [Opitutales bacterium]
MNVLTLLNDSPESLTLLAEAPPPGGFPPILFFLFLIAAMYFLLIAPQRKRQKDLQKMISDLGTGDEVLTAGGLYGTVTNVKSDRFVVKVAENTKVEVNKNHIISLVKKGS